MLQILKKKNFYLGVGAFDAPKRRVPQPTQKGHPKVSFALCVLTLIDDMVFYSVQRRISDILFFHNWSSNEQNPFPLYM